jgi:hypothetical protein
MYIAKDYIFKNNKTRTHVNIYVLGWGVRRKLEGNENLTSYAIKNKR